MRRNDREWDRKNLWVAVMCECGGKGFVKVALPQGVPFRDRAAALRICSMCNGVDSELETALNPIKMTVQQYFERRLTT